MEMPPLYVRGGCQLEQPVSGGFRGGGGGGGGGGGAGGRGGHTPPNIWMTKKLLTFAGMYFLSSFARAYP